MDLEKITDLEQLDIMIATLRAVKRDLKRRDKLSDKARGMSHQANTPKQIGAANTNLNWACMELDKSKVNFARMFEGSCVDVGTHERTYNPSGFHEYVH